MLYWCYFTQIGQYCNDWVGLNIIYICIRQCIFNNIFFVYIRYSNIILMLEAKPFIPFCGFCHLNISGKDHKIFRIQGGILQFYFYSRQINLYSRILANPDVQKTQILKSQFAYRLIFIHHFLKHYKDIYVFVSMDYHIYISHTKTLAYTSLQGYLCVCQHGLSHIYITYKNACIHLFQYTRLLRVQNFSQTSLEKDRVYRVNIKMSQSFNLDFTDLLQG
eukprot:TRINITY_DN2805_c0_g1_i4.p3 TRINITY_DN2805_c0_g1~~TRINITY_DN2805_c0_g1_i4.p3  ORF type:complete len:220 (+),score=-21.97 TRINITY_DN2805_c0_g1_i4:924-1583(+)